MLRLDRWQFLSWCGLSGFNARPPLSGDCAGSVVAASERCDSGIAIARRLAAPLAAAALGVLIVPLADARSQTPAPAAPPQGAAIGKSSVPPAPSAEFPPIEVADTLMYHKRYQEAIAKYAVVEPKTSEVWNKMGIAYQMMYNVNDSMHCYKESLKLKPGDAQVWNNLGTLYESQLDHRRAAKMFRKAVQLDPKFALAYKNLATSLMEEHKYREGRAADARALAIDPAIFAAGDYLTVSNATSARDRGAMNYFMAIDCIHAGQKACALEHLRMALNQGYTSANKVAADNNFAALANDPAFQQLLAEQRVNK
jgi:tetratricopeptide (TPR) repeat protein